MGRRMQKKMVADLQTLLLIQNPIFFLLKIFRSLESGPGEGPSSPLVMQYGAVERGGGFLQRV